mgnify:FL=1
MDKVALKGIEETVFQFNIKSYIGNITKTDEEINEKYLKGEVRIVTEQARYPLSTIKDMFNGQDYILNPDFQRRLRWDRIKQSKLIESFIINVPIPPIFLYEKDYSIYEVMDGLQRITAIKEFYEDKYTLEGLDIWPELNGKKYSTLPEQVRKGIDRRYISSIILLKETAKDSETAKALKQLVFSRINSGGAKLEDQEYRNALYPGPFNDLTIELARNQTFCDIFDIPLPTETENLSEDIISTDLRENPKYRTMKDVETVLRFFAMLKIEYWENVTLSKFLDLFLECANKLPGDAIEYYKNLFEHTIQLACDIYGEKTFCMWKKNSKGDTFRWTKRATTVLYDPLMVVLSENINNREYLVSIKDNIVNGTKDLFEKNDDLLNGRNTSSSNVKERIRIFREYFNSL